MKKGEKVPFLVDRPLRFSRAPCHPGARFVHYHHHPSDLLPFARPTPLQRFSKPLLPQPPPPPHTMPDVYPYDAPSRNPYQRPVTPSKGRYLSSAVFRSSSERFKYMGRMAPREVNQPPEPRPEETKKSTTKRAVRADNKSETIVGMTFARAMGIDETEHKPKGQKRDAIFKEPLLDYEPYDHSKDEEKRRRSIGFAVDKVGRSGGRFYGQRWRGCANLVPTNLPSNPTSYVAPKPFERTRKPTDTARSIMDNKTDRLGTIDGLRLSLNNIPKAKSFVHEKLGPGSYKDYEARAAKEDRGGILLNEAYEGSSFKGTGRKDREGDWWDVFRDASIKKKEDLENTKKVKMASSGEDVRGAKDEGGAR